MEQILPGKSMTWKSKELPDTYTIFITEKDFYGKGEPFYLIERMNLTTGNELGDTVQMLPI